ncbi:MAG: hypothetical protein HY263_08475 [Chloroflexi bacterium]|nr:hypothetical protein [Chloroflexota bacterium]
MTLQLDGGLCGAPSASVIFPATLASSAVAAPALDAAGGFAGYVPLPTIPAHATVVISLSR